LSVTIERRVRSGAYTARTAGKIARKLLRSRRRRYWTREQVQLHQQQSLRELRAFVYERSPFYRAFHKGLFDQPLEALPVLTKTTMMEHFDDLVTDRAIRLAGLEQHIQDVVDSRYTLDTWYLGRYQVNETSGSSGVRGVFLHDRDELVSLVVSLVRTHQMTGAGIKWIGRPRVAAIAATNPLGIAGNIHRFGRAFRDRTLHLNSVEPVDSLVRQLNDFQPSALVIWGRLGGVLAEAQRAGELRIAPNVIVSSAEILTDSVRRSLKAAWDAEVIDTYGSTEVGMLASECALECGMHLLDDQVIVENVDEKNQPVPPGEYGAKVLVTVLFRTTQPLIRYELTDMLRLAAEPCTCGRPYPLIDDIQGRLWDVLYFDRPQGGSVPIHPRVLNRVLERFPVEWQVIQQPAGLRVLLSTIQGPVDDADLSQKLREVIVAQGAVEPAVVVERVSELPKTPGGKIPLIRSEVPRQPISG
jgi:putative adenylate-forming enzyme